MKPFDCQGCSSNMRCQKGKSLLRWHGNCWFWEGVIIEQTTLSLLLSCGDSSCRKALKQQNSHTRFIFTVLFDWKLLELCPNQLNNHLQTFSFSIFRLRPLFKPQFLRSICLPACLSVFQAFSSENLQPQNNVFTSHTLANLLWHK